MEDAYARHGLQGVLRMTPNDTRKIPWLDRMEKMLDSLPASEATFVSEILGEVDTSKFVAADYEVE